MKAILIKCCVLLALLAIAASGASATVGYVHAPPFAPQRTMFWTFDTQQTWQTPITAVGPTWDTNDPTNGDWTCDNITFSDNLQWFGTNSNWGGRTGMIGLDNTQGESWQRIWVKFHINNYANQNPIKKLWFEHELITWGKIVPSVDLTVPEGYQWSKINGAGFYDDLNPGERLNELWHIRPNPDWEEITWTANVPIGTGILIDKIFISTACVPEPSALLALGTGVIGLIGFASKKRRA